jgi:hypothetical protein
MSESTRTLYSTLQDSQEKYVYFLLTGAGAAIAFAVTQTQTAALTPSKGILGLAVLSWGLSFFCGCRQISHRNSFVFQNYQFLRMQAGEMSEFPPHPQLVQVIREDLEAQSKSLSKWSLWQFRFLLAGAGTYILWHVTEMYLRTVPHY